MGTTAADDPVPAAVYEVLAVQVLDPDGRTVTVDRRSRLRQDARHDDEALMGVIGLCEADDAPMVLTVRPSSTPHFHRSEWVAERCELRFKVG